MSIVNGLRRSIIADVITAGFRFDATNNDAQDVAVTVNTSPLHNEMLCDRVGLLPVCLTKGELLSFTAGEWRFELDVANDGVKPIDITSASMSLLGASNLKAFPADPVTGRHPLIAVLMPGQRLALEATASLGSGREHARFNPVAACAMSPVEGSSPPAFRFSLETQCGLTGAEVVECGLEALGSRMRAVAASAHGYPDAPPQSGSGPDIQSVRIDNDDGTAGAILQSRIMGSTDLVGFFSPHPLDEGIVMRARVAPGESIRDIIRDAAVLAGNEIESILSQWRAFSGAQSNVSTVEHAL